MQRRSVVTSSNAVTMLQFCVYREGKTASLVRATSGLRRKRSMNIFSHNSRRKLIQIAIQNKNRRSWKKHSPRRRSCNKITEPRCPLFACCFWGWLSVSSPWRTYKQLQRFPKNHLVFFLLCFALKYLALMMEVWLQNENAYKMQKREHHLFVVGVYCGRKKEFQQDSSVLKKKTWWSLTGISRCSSRFEVSRKETPLHRMDCYKS